MCSLSFLTFKQKSSQNKMFPIIEKITTCLFRVRNALNVGAVFLCIRHPCISQQSLCKQLVDASFQHYFVPDLTKIRFYFLGSKPVWLTLLFFNLTELKRWMLKWLLTKIRSCLILFCFTDNAVVCYTTQNDLIFITATGLLPGVLMCCVREQESSENAWLPLIGGTIVR